MVDRSQQYSCRMSEREAEELEEHDTAKNVEKAYETDK